MNRRLEVPPALIKIIQPSNKELEQVIMEPVHPVQKNIIYEIWKLYLEKIEDEVNEVYVVISADYDFDGYNLGEWNNIQYNGFYTTANDAENEIYGYLNKQE